MNTQDPSEAIGLDVFVRDALVQVMRGIREAQEIVTPGSTIEDQITSGRICPDVRFTEDSTKTRTLLASLTVNPQDIPVETVQFDVAVVASGKTAAGAGILNVVRLGMDKEASQEATHRIQFGVKVAWPVPYPRRAKDST